MEENIDKKQLQDKAATNALRIENSVADYMENCLKGVKNLDEPKQMIIESLLADLTDMSVSERVNVLRTITSAQNSTASSILSTLTAEYANGFLTQARDREATDANSYDAMFQSHKEQPQLLMNMSNLSEILSGTKK